jgi:hypothetical protein
MGAVVDVDYAHRGLWYPGKVFAVREEEGDSTTITYDFQFESGEY